MEQLQILELLARTGELDGSAGDSLDRQRRAAAGIAVELRQDDAGDVQKLVEGFRDVDRVLTGHRVDGQKDLVGVNLRLDVLQLLHELFIDMQTAGGIEDHDIVAVVFRVANRFLRDPDGVFGAHLKDRYLRLRADDLQLFDRRGTIDVARDQHRTVILFLEPFAQL